MDPVDTAAIGRGGATATRSMRYGFPRRGREFNALCRGGSAALPPGLTLHPSRNEKSSSAVASQMQVIYERSGWASVDSVGERCRRASTASAVAQAHHTVCSLVSRTTIGYMYLLSEGTGHRPGMNKPVSGARRLC